MNDQPPQIDENGNPTVVIYTTMTCPFCHRAKHLLNKKGINYTEVDVTMRPDKRLVMRERAGGVNTVPQIFIGERHVGGCDDLFELEFDGELDALLGGTA